MKTRPLKLTDLRALRSAVEKRIAKRAVARWNPDPEDVQRSVAKLVLALVELVRQLLERQTLRRMDRGTLTPQQIEAMGQALMRLEETVAEIAAKFDLDPSELNVDLGPLGRLV